MFVVSGSDMFGLFTVHEVIEKGSEVWVYIGVSTVVEHSSYRACSRALAGHGFQKDKQQARLRQILKSAAPESPPPVASVKVQGSRKRASAPAETEMSVLSHTCQDETRRRFDVAGRALP
jgi:hypothetical protein